MSNAATAPQGATRRPSEGDYVDIPAYCPDLAASLRQRPVESACLLLDSHALDLRRLGALLSSLMDILAVEPGHARELIAISAYWAEFRLNEVREQLGQYTALLAQGRTAPGVSA